MSCLVLVLGLGIGLGSSYFNTPEWRTPGVADPRNGGPKSPFRATTFSRTRHHVFLLRVITMQRISVFSFWYKFAFITPFMQAKRNTETLEYIGREKM